MQLVRDGGEQVSDEELMERYRDGNAAAFDALYARHKGPVYRYLRRQCSPDHVADELFQDVWMRLVAARARYRPDAKFTTFLYRIAHNRLIDHYRASGRTPTANASTDLANGDRDGDDAVSAADDLAASTGNPEEALTSRRLQHNLRVALDGLPHDQRDAFLLHEEGGLSLEEIAQTMGVGRETVKSRLRYALRKLRDTLGGE